uniref:E3 ubiquitin-protein ligase n=1 Tax=Phallusia mammillata TaxID=59560 RepID=A0A6F9DGU8_9ASCI|nr:uncharacterized protein LOC100175735 [Phallusia mammillata]
MAHLLSGTKLNACVYLRKCFEQDPGAAIEHVHAICDELLNPEDSGANRETAVDWLQILFACYSNGNYQEFSAKLTNVDSSPLCGCVWTADFVAYRCRTCATSPCMSLCAACFERGNHKGHDYNIFRSEAGGACDCGDASVMHKSGFCSHHGPNRISPKPLPTGYLNVAKVLLDRMVLFLCHVLRSLSANVLSPETFQVNFPGNLKHLFTFMLELIKLGSVIRSHLCNLLLNEPLYVSLLNCRGYKCVEDNSNHICKLHAISVREFSKSVQTLRKPLIPEEIRNREYFDRPLQYRRYLDELTYWIVRYEFPEPLILILLNLLPDLKFKCEFARSFTQHYSRIASSLTNSVDVSQLSNRVVHISVQLFSNDEIALTLTNDAHLLQIFMIAAHNIIFPILEPSTTGESDFHQCVMTQSNEVRNNAYWPIFSDFINVLSHKKCVIKFLSNPDLLNCWIQLMLGFSGMDLMKREMQSHIEFESNSTLLAFYTEREACASPLWCFLDVLQDGSTAHLTLSMCQTLLVGLTDFFDALGFETDLPFDQLSFHYPLHRYLALFISNALVHQGVEIEDIKLKLSENDALKIMQHPLHVLVAMYEVQCGMWIRNGAVISTQSLAYKQYFFCTFLIDADIYLLQFCALLVSPDVFITNIFERCRVTNCLTILNEIDESMAPPGAPDSDRRPKMLESAFLLLVSLLGIKTNVGLQAEEIIESEAVVLLTSKECTYSSLHDHIPQCHESHSGTKLQHNTEILVNCLQKLAIKKEGGAMEQTTYVPNEKSWQLYDPIFTEHRTLYKRHIRQAHENYCRYLKSTGKLGPDVPNADVWPPYKEITAPSGVHSNLVSLLHCSTLHAFIYIILYKSLHEHEVVTDTTLALSLHLLEASLRLSPNNSGPTSTSNLSRNTGFSSWFDSNDMQQNIMKVIDQIEAPSYQDSGLPLSVLHAGESILSLLLKLFDKFSEQPAAFSLDRDSHMTFSHNLDPPIRCNVIRKVLNLAASLSKNIEQNIKVIYKTLHPVMSSVTSPNTHTLSAADERMRRRLQAREAQKKMMNQIKLQQKQFIENNEDNLTVVDEGMNDVTMTDVNAQPSYECCICGSSEATRRGDDASDFGLICVVQPSTLLGHKKQTPKRPTPKKPNNLGKPENFATFCEKVEIKSRFVSLRSPADLPEEGGSLAPVGGCHVTTCGHHVHIACHAVYMESLSRDQFPFLMMDNQQFFKCPLCRQVSNLVLQCTTSSEEREFHDHPPLFSIAESYYEVYEKCKDYMSGPTLKNTYTAFLAVFDHALLQLGGSLLSPAVEDISKTALKAVVERKIPIDSLCYMLINNIEKPTHNVEDQWRETFGGGLQVNNATPILCLDTSALFVRLIMDLLNTDPNYKKSPHLGSNLGMYQSYVQDVYNLTFIQALVRINCKFSDDERRAWRSGTSTGFKFVGSNLECLISHVIRSLPPRLFQAAKQPPPSVFTTVFSNQSIFTLIEEHLLPFMRHASLIQHHVIRSGEALPIHERGRAEFVELAMYLGLSKVSTDGDVDVVKCLDWKNNDSKSLISSWCSKLLLPGGSSYTTRYQTLTASNTWHAPKLLDLPDEYSSLFLTFRQTECKKCGKVPKDPALCLVCGEYVCYKSPCKPDKIPYAACRHARRCGAGTGIFLLINTSYVVIIRGHKACMWGTLYLDAHGEEDRGWSRGKPLYLKRERLLVLERQWIYHSFDNSCKNWMVHSQKL